MWNQQRLLLKSLKAHAKTIQRPIKTYLKLTQRREKDRTELTLTKFLTGQCYSDCCLIVDSDSWSDEGWKGWK